MSGCQIVPMERPLTTNEMAVLERLTAVDQPGAEQACESLPFVIVDDECDCGCDGFGVRDPHYPRQDYHLRSWVDAMSRDGTTELGLLLGSDGRIKYLDIYRTDHGKLPDAKDLEVLP